MDDVEIPPDATVFRSGGRTYYLYMGALEMRALQREWGLVRSMVDSTEAWEKKQQEFQDRLNGGAMEDKLAVLRHALTRWAKAWNELKQGTNGSAVQLDDDAVARIVEEMEVPKGTRRKAAFVRLSELHRRFYFDCFGMRPEAEEKDPKEPGGAEDSTPSGS